MEGAGIGMPAVAGQRRLLHARTLMLVALIALFGALTINSAPAQAAFTFTVDENGANDEPGQKDLTRHGVDATNLPTSLAVTWNWDTTGFSGANTGDACAMFDNDDNGFIDFAVCVTINQDPAVQAATSPRVFTCGDDKVDRCTTPIFQIPSPTSTCTVAITATQPFAAGESTPNDTTATCTIQMSDVGGTTARMVNTCSFPSNNPNSDPSDCVLIIRDGFLRIVKNASPNDAGAQFNFFLDGAVTPVFTSNGSGTSSIIPINTQTNPHALTETAPTGWTLASATCSDGSAVNSINVAQDETVTCTFNNVRQTGKLEVKKSLSPTTDTGKFDLQIDGTTDPNADDVGHNGSTGEETLNTGNHTVGEVAGASTDLANYQKSIECRDTNGTGSVVASVGVDNAGPLTVNVTSGSDIVCVITNTRETGKLEVKKSLIPTTDPGKVDLQIDGTTDPNADDVGHNGSTGEETLNTGTHTVGEIAGASTDLADYDKSIECKDDNGTGAVVASVAADNAGPLNVNVTTGSDIVCVVTNTRETGKLEVQKDLSPSTDGGLFNLQIDGTTDGDASDVGDGGSTGEETLDTGDHTVGETAGTDTALADYQKSIECKDDNGAGSVVAGTTGDNAGPLTVPVTTGSDIVCVITNTRETGKLEVQKDLSPSTDGGLFNLQIDGTTDGDATDVGDGGSTGEEILDTGDHTVGETAGTDTDLADYAKSIECKADNGAGAVVASTTGDDAGPLTVSVTTGSDIVCVVTNTRETGKLEVTKDLSPSTDDGLFNLQIGGNTDTDATNVGDGGSTGEETLNTGSHTVGETAGTNTDLTDYQKSIECRAENGTGAVVASVGTDNASLQVNVTTGSDIVCVITNTRETGKLEVQKDLSPSTDDGLFNLQIDGTTDTDATNVGDGGSTGEETLNTGDHTVGETAGTNTDLADYQKSIVCKDDNGTGTTVASTTGDNAGPLTVAVTTDSDIICVVTNTRETGKLEVQKDLNPSTDTGRFNLLIDGSSPDLGSQNVGDGGTTGEETLDTGDHTVGESAVIGTDLADYDKSIECKADNGTGAVVASVAADNAGPLNVNVTTGSDIVCVITNTRETGKLEVQKDLSPTTDGGLFNLQIDGTTDGDATDVGDGGSTGEATLNTGDHTVGETAGTNTDLDDYQKSIECKDDNGTGAVVAGTTGDDAGPLTVSVTTGSDIVCVVTNTRETGKLEVQKDLSPSTDGGLFNLQIDGTTDGDASDVGDGGSTGEETLDTGDHTVGETAGTDTALADYQKSIECKDDNGAGSVVAGTTGDNAGPLTVPVTTGSDIVCVITNTRETGKLEVQKDLSPSTDGGLFNLQIDGTTDGDATDVGDGGSTGEEILDTGDHTVGETAGTDTDLADYAKSIECKADNGAGAVVASTTGDDAGPLTVSVTTGSDIVCVVTNTRETGKLEVRKNLDPATDTGRFNLLIDGSSPNLGSQNVGDGGSTGEETLNTGDHTVGESAVIGTDLADYAKSIECKDDNGTGATVASTTGDDAGPLTVAVTTDSDIVCVVTNTRESGKLEVQKDLSPSTDTGRFNLLIDGSSPSLGSLNVGDGGTTGEQTLDTGDHTVGESAVIGTDLADYAKSIECRDDNGAGSVVASTTSDDAGPLTVPVTTASDIVCVITNTRETGNLEVQKDLSPTTDTGRFNLLIDGSSPNLGSQNVGDGGTTGEETLDTGDHTVGESAVIGTDLADYAKSIECKDDNGAGSVVASTTSDDAGPLTVPVTTGSDIVCVITNTRETGKLEVQKDLSPTTDDGLFNLQIDGTTDTDATDVGDGGSTGEETLNTGDHTVGETAGTDTDLADYQKSVQCRDQDGTGDVVAETPTGDNGGPLTVPVTTDSDIVCVITNTRETGKLEVRKAVSPSSDGGLFNLQIDGTTDPDATDVGDSGSTGEEILDTGDHTVGETAGTGTDLADYQKSIVCRDDNGTGAVVAGTTGDDGGPLTVQVTTDSDIVCKITNSRDTGKLEVQKDLSPTTDGGLFNLQIDGTTDTDATDVGDGGSTGEKTVNTGDHEVGETAGTDTDLADYQKSIECKDDNGGGSVVASTTGDDAGPLTVSVTADSDIVCVITNTRETGKLEVLKTLDPDTDPGKFNLQIDGTTDSDATDVGDSGSTGEETLDTGDHTVGEAAGTGTDLDDYQKSIVCRDDNGTGAVVAETPAGDDAGPLTVAVTTDSDIVCLITNTRETGKLEVRKDLNPSTDAGRFNLLIDSSSPNAGSQNVGDGGTTGERTLNTGDHTVGESAVLGTDLAKYAKSIVCRDGNGSGDTVAGTTSDDAGPLTVPVTLGDDIVCVITNTRETGKLEVRKDLEPNTDPGKFNLQIDNVTDPDAINVGDGGSTGEQVLNTGNHTVRETAGTATNAADYLKSIVCKGDNGTGTVVASSSGSPGPLAVNVTDGSDIVCTITNTRKTGKLEVIKKVNPTTDAGRFDLRIDGNVEKDEAAHNGTTGEKRLNTGNHTVSETADGETTLTDYSSSIECKATNGTGAVVAQGTGSGPVTVNVINASDIVCTITNTRKTGKLEVIKKVNPTTDAGRFDLRIDGNVEKDEAAHNGTTGEKTLNTGDHTVSETADGETSLANYSSAIECKASNGTGAIVASGTGTGPVTVNVTDGSDILCTITNTRKTGKLEVVKKVNPTTDLGRFDLRIDNTVEKDEAAHNDTTGEKSLNTGDHTVAETADGETSLANYSSAIECKASNGTGAIVASGTGTGPVTVNVTDGSDIVCTITNTRKTGKLEVVKKVNPTTDAGRFDLRIDNTVEKDEAAHNDTTGEKTLNTGDHTVSETADGETTLTDYSASIECKADNGTGAIVASGTGTGPVTVNVTAASDIVCTITNTRKAGKLEVIKKVNPTTDAGRFDLRIDSNVEKDEAAHNDTTGEKAVNTGTHTVSETADGETTLTDYTSSIECKGANGAGAVVAQTSGSGPLNVSVSEGSDIVCTITNARKTGKLEVVKHVNPTTDPGRFDLRIDNVVVRDEAPHGGTTGEVTVNTGNHTVAETVDMETTLTDYTSTIECKAGNGTGATVAQATGSGPLTVNVTEGSDIVCVITNSRTSTPGRMTGGGSILGTNPSRTTHGFTLHCDRTVKPNRLEVNWSGNHWHLEVSELIYAICTNDPAFGPYPPTAGFDTYSGAGYGRYNGVSGALGEWIFTDAGEPGSADTAKIKITDVGGNVVLDISGSLNMGNQQAHK